MRVYYYHRSCVHRVMILMNVNVDHIRMRRSSCFAVAETLSISISVSVSILMRRSSCFAVAHRATFPLTTLTIVNTARVWHSRAWHSLSSAVLKQRITGDPIMMDHSSDGQHGQPSILEFLQGHGILFILALANGESHGIEAEVPWDSGFILEHGEHGNVSLVGPEFKDSHPYSDL